MVETVKNRPPKTNPRTAVWFDTKLNNLAETARCEDVVIPKKNRKQSMVFGLEKLSSPVSGRDMI